MKKSKGHYVQIREFEYVIDPVTDKPVKIEAVRNVKCPSKIDALDFIREISGRTDILNGYYLGKF